MGSLLDKIKADVKNSGSNKGKLFYGREDEKKRVRFLIDFEDGMDITFHDSYAEGVNEPCAKHYGKQCSQCGNTNLRTRSQYAWSVWDYDAKDVKLMLFATNNYTPVPQLTAMYENYGTVKDRDFIISYTGKASDKKYTVVPMDKAKFRNDKAKPFSKEQVFKILKLAFPSSDGDNDDDVMQEDIDISKYDDMTAKELYKLCKERDINCEPKKKSNYYATLLAKEDAKFSVDSWDDEEWNEEEDAEPTIDYSKMTAQELFKLCKDRDIDCEPKKKSVFYINLLEEYDNAHNEWGDDNEEEWDEI